MDLRNRVVALDSETLTLTSVEYRLLAILVQHAGEIVPRPILLTLTPTVDAHVWRLQKKTRGICLPVHRRGRRRIPFPTHAKVLGFEELFHCVGTDRAGSRRGCRFWRGARDRIL